MNLKLEIETGESCLFKVKDLSEDYALEDTLEMPKDIFKYSDTISIAILTLHNSSNQNVQYLEPLFLIHKIRHELFIINTKFNGYFDFIYVVLPTEKWIQNNQNKLNLYNKVFYSNGKQIYKYSNGETIKISPKELLTEDTINTTISKVEDSLVSICYIKKYLIQLCDQIYNTRIFSKCSFNKSPNKELIYKRDLIWSIINLISYYTDLGALWEALRLIELVKNCDKFINDNNCKICHQI